MIDTKLGLTVLILMLVSSVCTTKTELHVELVHVLFRHGERVPRERELWPNDTYDMSTYYPWGLGQLTNQGKMREYRIGQMLRSRYDKLLGDIYSPSAVYAYSTDHDRTKMSLQLVLAGLYPPAPVQKWNEALPWMPIPTQYMPEKVDNLMKPDFSPVYLDAVKEVRQSEEIRNKVSVYEDLFKFLSEKTGINIIETSYVYEIYNMIVAQGSLNLARPEWCTDEIYKKMQDVTKLEYGIRSYTPQLKRLNGGPLIKRFIEHMQLAADNANLRKMYLYSGHETNIAGFVRAHGFTQPDLPSYGCAIIIEKLSDAAGKKFIRMILWTGITEEFIPYKLSGCDEICPMDKYLELVNDVLPSEEELNHKWDYISKDELRKLYDEKVNCN